MKLLKKLVSVACAISMMATMAVTVANAVGKPTVYITYDATTDYDATTGEGSFVVGISDVSDVLTESKDGVTTVDLTFGIDSAIFDTSIYTAGGEYAAKAQYQPIPGYDYWADLEVLKNATITKGPYVANGGFVKVIMSSLDLKDGTDLFKFKFKTLDAAAPASIDINDVYVSVNTYNSDGTFKGASDLYASKDAVSADDEIVIVAGSGNDDTNAPVQVGGGVIEDTVGDSKDAAVAYTQKFTAVAGNKVRWNLTCNKIGETDKINGSYTYTIANLETEGDVNIGLIIQYDPSVYENVVVTDGAIVTE